MKKIIFAFSVIIFTSCGAETSSFTNEPSFLSIPVKTNHQFVVGEISRVDDNTCKYVDSQSNNWITEAFCYKACFIAKKGQFQVGDTISVCKFVR